VAAELPLLCRMDALDQRQRERHRALLSQLKAAVQDVKELTDGYAFGFSSDAFLFLCLAEWVTLERACCPFLTFELLFEEQEGSIRLTLRGRQGVKDFLKSEFRISPGSRG